MNRRLLAGLLLVAAAVVVVENYLYFKSGSGAVRSASRSADSDEAFESDSDGSSGSGRTPPIGPPPPLSAEELALLLMEVERERSPFRPGVSRKGVGASGFGLPQLGGTMIGRDRRVAWVDGRPRAVGDPHGEFVVESIEEGRVVLVRDDRTYTLELETDPPPPEEKP